MIGGGAAMDRTTGGSDVDRIWSEASLRLRAEIGDGPFSSYIAPSAVRVDDAGLARRTATVVAMLFQEPGPAPAPQPT